MRTVDAWTTFSETTIILVLLGVIVWGVLGWRQDRADRRAWQKKMDAILNTTCPDCGRSRLFVRDGKEMLAPPHKGRCVQPYDYERQGL